MHDLTILVRDFDADGGFAGNRRKDAHIGTGHRIGDVALQVGDFSTLTPDPSSTSYWVTEGPRKNPTTLASTLNCSKVEVSARITRSFAGVRIACGCPLVNKLRSGSWYGLLASSSASFPLAAFGWPSVLGMLGPRRCHPHWLPHKRRWHQPQLPQRWPYRFAWRWVPWVICRRPLGITTVWSQQPHS